MKKIFFGMLFSVLFLSPLFAHAEPGRPYVGFSLGETEHDGFCDGTAALGFTCDETDVGFKFYIGIDLDETFAVEASFVDLGEASFGVPPYKGKFDVWALSADVLAKMPFDESFSIFGKAGLALWSWDFSENFLVFGPESDSGIDLKFGFGAELNLQDNIGIRAEYEIYDVDDVDVNFTSLGIVIDI